MTKLIQTLGLLLLTYNAFAQIPDYFGNNPSWGVTEFIGAGYIDEYPSGFDDRVRYYVSGTYDIGDYTYFRVKQKTYRKDLSAEGPYTYDYYPPCESYEMFVRQEGRSIYYYEDGVDSLLISYDLEVGDELNGAYYYHHYDLYHVVSIDSVLVGDEYRKRFNFSVADAGYFPYLIEGIGYRNADVEHIDGHFFGYPSGFDVFGIGFELRLTCYGENGIDLWGDEGDCFLTMSVEDDEQTNKLDFYPNPVTDDLNILNDTKINSVSIYSIDGQLVQSEMVDDFSHILDMSTLVPALYFVEVQLANDQVYRQTIVKN